MNLIHEHFNQYFTKKYSDQNFKFTSKYKKYLHLTLQSYYDFYKSLMLFLWHMFFLACVKRQIFLWYKIYFNMWRWIFQKLRNI